MLANFAVLLLAHHPVAVGVPHVLIGRVSRWTGAMPWARASAHVIRPLPLSSHIARASISVGGVLSSPARMSGWSAAFILISGGWSQVASIVATAPCSEGVIVRSQLCLTSVQARAYWHHDAWSGGFYSSGPRAPLLRLCRELIAIR